MALFVFSLILFGTLGVPCPGHTRCECLGGYISCRGVVSLPDVLVSKLYPLRETPATLADLRGSALSDTVMRRFLRVYSSIRRVIMTEQLELPCHYMSRLQADFPQVNFETDCQVSQTRLSPYD